MQSSQNTQNFDLDESLNDAAQGRERSQSTDAGAYIDSLPVQGGILESSASRNHVILRGQRKNDGYDHIAQDANGYDLEVSSSASRRSSDHPATRNKREGYAYHSYNLSLSESESLSRSGLRSPYQPRHYSDVIDQRRRVMGSSYENIEEHNSSGGEDSDSDSDSDSDAHSDADAHDDDLEDAMSDRDGGNISDDDLRLPLQRTKRAQQSQLQLRDSSDSEDEHAHTARDANGNVTSDYTEIESIVPGVDNAQILKFSRDYGDVDWNRRFQKIIQVIRKVNEAPRAVNGLVYETKVAACFALINLARDFSYAAQTYGKIIIAEAHRKRKRIQPVALGGSLGGTKFVVQNILFKFAVNDDESPLFESDYEASLVAGHELKGALAYFNLIQRNSDLQFRVPLMCLVDYLGYRLVCTAKLDIGASTLVSGSSDCGVTVLSNDKTLNTMLDRAGQYLGIRTHLCGRDANSLKRLSCAIDLEGHRGADGNYYLVDFSRTFPPEDPKQLNTVRRNTHLFCLFRPEFMKIYGKKLCNDTFTQFVAHDPHNVRYQHQVQAATKFLRKNLIPDCAERLDTAVRAHYRNATLHQFSVTNFMHSYGIGMHWAGSVRKHCKREEARTLLLIEMVVRVVKNDFRAQLRRRGLNMNMPTEEPYRRVVVDLLNRIFGSASLNSPTLGYWNQIKKDLEYKFPKALTPVERDPDYPLHFILFSFKVCAPRSKHQRRQRQQPQRPVPQAEQKKSETLPAKSSALFQIIRRNCGKTGLAKLFQSVGLVYRFQITNALVKKGKRPEVYTVNLKNATKDTFMKLGDTIANPDCSIEVDCRDLVMVVAKPQRLTLQEALDAELIHFRKGTPEMLHKLLPLMRAPESHYNKQNMKYDGKYLLLKGIQGRLAIVWNFTLTPETYMQSALLSTRRIANLEPTPFTGLDIIDMRPVVKEMNVVANAQGVVNLHIGAYYGTARNRYLLTNKAFKYLESAYECFKEALKQSPDDYESIVNCLTYLLYHNKYSWDGELLGDESVEFAKRERAEKAGELIQLGLRVRPNDAHILFLAAELLADLKLFEQAEDLYLASIEADPSRGQVWSRYGRLLSWRGEMNWTDLCYERAKVLQKKLDQVNTTNFKYSKYSQ
jgi:tetratricopeptide (TPR) repeat protein